MQYSVVNCAKRLTTYLTLTLFTAYYSFSISVMVFGVTDIVPKWALYEDNDTSGSRVFITPLFTWPGAVSFNSTFSRLIVIVNVDVLLSIDSSNSDAFFIAISDDMVLECS